MIGHFDCGVQRSWQRTWFGTMGPGVRVSSPRPLMLRVFSSVGQSYRLITGWSGVRVPEGPPPDETFSAAQAQGYSSVGRVLVSKTMGRGFKSFCPCHKRNVFCLPRQKAFLLAFRAKIGQNKGKSGFQAVDQPSGSPFFCFQDAKKVENAGVLFAFLCSAKNTKKIRVGRI